MRFGKLFLPLAYEGTLSYYMMSWVQYQYASWPQPWLLLQCHRLPSTDRNIRHEMSFTDPRELQEYVPSRGVIEGLKTVSGKGNLQGVICIHGVMLSTSEGAFLGI